MLGKQKIQKYSLFSYIFKYLESMFLSPVLLEENLPV